MNEPRVRGTATVEDVAAIAAVLAARTGAAPKVDGYRRWRRTRRAVLLPALAAELSGRIER